MQYRQRLEEMERRFDALTAQMADPAIINDPSQYRKIAKAQNDLSDTVAKFREWKTVQRNLEEARPMLDESDAELRSMAQEEIAGLEPRLAAIEDELKFLLLPKDPNDEKNVVLEIRAGTGGDEATLFAAEIFRMYIRFAETRRWNVEVTSSSESSVGGLKEVIALISGTRFTASSSTRAACIACSAFRRRNSRAASTPPPSRVAVLPEADEVEIVIDPKDIRIDTFCSSGPGGQSVNTTYSAVRLTHCRRPGGFLPGRKIADQESGQGTARASLAALRAGARKATGKDRRRAADHGRHGDRSEKIRTYNFPQNRVTDHRIGLTLHQLDQVMEGQARSDHRRADPVLSNREVERAGRSRLARSDNRAKVRRAPVKYNRRHVRAALGFARL
jgi:peptide chain release factor 1